MKIQRNNIEVVIRDWVQCTWKVGILCHYYCPHSITFLLIPLIAGTCIQTVSCCQSHREVLNI